VFNAVCRQIDLRLQIKQSHLRKKLRPHFTTKGVVWVLHLVHR